VQNHVKRIRPDAVACGQEGVRPSSSETTFGAKFPNVTRLEGDFIKTGCPTSLATLKGHAFKTEVDAATRNCMHRHLF
jgi:hypothetical protein